MTCEVVIGATGTGKTEYIKEKISRVKRAIVYDYQNNEDFQYLPVFDGKKIIDKCRIVREYGFSYKDFRNIVEKFFFDKGYLIVCEEASAMFDTNAKDNQMNDFLLSKRHRKVNFILNFHNASLVPPFMLAYTDFVTIKMNMGGTEHMKKKFNEEVYKYSLLCEEDIRRTYTIGVSNITKGIIIEDYFEGETVSDKFRKQFKK